MLRTPKLCFFFTSMIVLFAAAVPLGAQSRSAARIRETVDDSKLVRLEGNTRPEAVAENDSGSVPDDQAIDHMMLQLKRPAEQEQALAQLIDQLHDAGSPNFHKWLTAADIGRDYGIAEADVKTITGWLEQQGFRVHSVYPNGMVIDFSGNAGQVRRAFHTSIHDLTAGGVRHMANFSDPRIPEALAPVVAGVVSMHDFRPHKQARARPDRAQYTYTASGQTFQAVVPADFAAIYDVNPLFAAGITGSGQTIAVIEDTNLYRTSDWTTFRSAFGLSQYTAGSLTTLHPAPVSGVTNCSSPGVNSDDSEAILDAEWASASAPGAAIVVASCANANVTSGLFIAAQNLVNSTAPPPIISFSYGECEAENGASYNASLSSLYQQAVLEGISVFVASGDEGAAACDAGLANATHGIGVSAFASTPYNVAVGGNRFRRRVQREHREILGGDKHRDLRVGFVLYSRGAVEQLVRKRAGRDLLRLSGRVWRLWVLQQQHRADRRFC